MFQHYSCAEATAKFNLQGNNLRIQYPVKNTLLGRLDKITGEILNTSIEDRSVIESVKLTLTNGYFFLNEESNKPLSRTPVILDAEINGSSWTYNLAKDLLPAGQYTITAYLHGKQTILSRHTVSFTIENPIFTTLELDSDRNNILQDTTVNLIGHLHYFPNAADIHLENLTIFLEIEVPMENKAITLETITDQYGNYSFKNLGVFFDHGSYQLRTYFQGKGRFRKNTSNTETINVKRFSGYVLLLEGFSKSYNDIQTYNKTISRIYSQLEKRGFEDKYIKYLNYNSDIKLRKQDFISALTDIKSYLNTSPAPLYIIMLGNANVEEFILEGDVITAQEINTWLDELEAGLDLEAFAEPRTIIIGSCFSGSFIPVLSKRGRLIITSAADDECPYQGLTESDNIRSADHFIETLFQQLVRGKNIQHAFRQAAAYTKKYTIYNNTVLTGNENQFEDNSVQHPLLDDNANTTGKNYGHLATNLILGVDEKHQASTLDDLVEITAVNETLSVGANSSSALLWLTVNAPTPVDDDFNVFVAIRPPLAIDAISSQSQLTAPKELNLISSVLQYNTAEKRYQLRYNRFDAPGRYDLFYYIQKIKVGDSDSAPISPVWHSIVYKNQSGNQAPKQFSLLLPENQVENAEKFIVPKIFDWEDSYDPDGLRYNFRIATDKEMQSIVYFKEDMTDSLLEINTTQILYKIKKDDWIDEMTKGDWTYKKELSYYWNAETIDAFGSRTTTPSSRFIFFPYDICCNDTGRPQSTDVVTIAQMDDVNLRKIVDNTILEQAFPNIRTTTYSITDESLIIPCLISIEPGISKKSASLYFNGGHFILNDMETTKLPCEISDGALMGSNWISIPQVQIIDFHEKPSYQVALESIPDDAWKYKLINISPY